MASITTVDRFSYASVRTRPTLVNVVTALVGLGLFVIGVVALLRTGLPTNTLTAPTVTVGWLEHTPLLAMIHIIVGASLVSLAAIESFPMGYASSAALLLVVGVIFWIEQGALRDSLALTRDHGMTYAAAGGLIAVGVAVSDWMLRRERR